MENSKKFCPNCGQETEKDTAFCSSCGYNFETKKEHTENHFSILDRVKTIKLNKKMVSILVVATLLLIFAASRFMGGNDLAGTYESEYTIKNDIRSSSIVISRNNNITFLNDDGPDSFLTEISARLMYDDESEIYTIDLSEGVDIELTVNSADFGDDVYGDIEELTNIYGFETSINGENSVISGHLNALEAERFGIDFDDIYISSMGGDILFNDNEWYIKQ